MYSTHISKVEKARTYAEERDRVTITGLAASFRGNHNTYQVNYDSGEWRCSCVSFASLGFCSHTMALDLMLEGMLPKPAATPSA